MELKRKNICPMLQKECMGLDCAWFTKIEGYDINSGKRVDEWNCTIAILPMLLIENSGQQRQTGAAVESFRNEMVKSTQLSQELFVAIATNDTKALERKLIQIDDNSNNLPPA